MSTRLKHLADQVVVITGASSGIGLTTARLAAARGAKLVVAARNESALRDLVAEIEGHGGEAIHVVADVGRSGDVRAVAEAAVGRFGRFDTWINNAGGAIYGLISQVSDADSRRLFDTNYWGVVYGSLEAVRHFRGRTEPYAGALINIGSILSDVSVPMIGMYCASKHAVKGFTDALRMEMEYEEVPVSVTLIKPSSINTPFPQHARNYMDQEPTLPPPLYAPDVVARAILHCAETPERDVTVGGGGKSIVVMGQTLPAFTDHLMAKTLPDAQKKGEPPRNPAGALQGPTFGLHERGDYSGPVLESSAYTAAAFHPLLVTALGLGAGLTVAALLRAGRSNHA